MPAVVCDGFQFQSFTESHQGEQAAKLVLLQVLPGVVIVVLPLEGSQVINLLPARRALLLVRTQMYRKCNFGCCCAHTSLLAARNWVPHGKYKIKTACKRLARRKGLAPRHPRLPEGSSPTPWLNLRFLSSIVRDTCCCCGWSADRMRITGEWFREVPALMRGRTCNSVYLEYFNIQIMLCRYNFLCQGVQGCDHKSTVSGFHSLSLRLLT